MRRRLGRLLADRRGFTLTELLASCAVIGLMMGALLGILMSGNQVYLTGSNQIEAQQSLRGALQQMMQEIAGAGYDPTAGSAFAAIVGPSPGFVNPTPTSLTIQNDNNGDGALAASERIWYRFADGTLQRQDFAVDASPRVVIAGVQGLTFTYFDVDGNVTTVAANIRAVEVSLTTSPEQQPGLWQGGRTLVTMRDRVRIRNR